MCQFKSGIIFKNRIVLAPEGSESHSALLESLGIEDSTNNAMTKFVKSDELRESELNSDFKWCEPSMYRGRYCLEFNL